MGDARFLKFGLLLLVGGVFMVGAFLSGGITVSVVYTIGIISIFCGVLLMAAGVFTVVVYEYMPKSGVREGDKNIFSTALLRCMLAISIADDVLDDGEVTELQKIYKHLTHTEIDEQTIRSTAEDMMENKVNIQVEMAHVVNSLDKESRKKLIIASLYILAADGDMDSRELIMLDDIRQGLKLGIEQVEKIKNDFFAKRELREV